MITYITAFIFYTLAMVGILLIGFVVYKKTMMGAKSDNKGVIKVIDSLAIGPKKTLLVVKIRNEKFLIASGAEHTTFLAKLADNDVVKNPSCEVPVQARKPVQKDNEYASVPLFQTKEVSYDEIAQASSSQAQRQFMELYEKAEAQEAKPHVNMQSLKKKELLKQLLNNLDIEQTKTGSGF